MIRLQRSLILILFFLCSCSTDVEKEQKNIVDRLDYCIIASRIRTQTAHELEKRYNLKLTGFGGGQMDLVKSLSLSMNTHKPIKVNEARILIVNCLETFLKNINTNKIIRPYLIEYPFPERRIDFTIFVRLDETEQKKLNSLNYFSSHRGKLSYYEYDHLVHEEPYEKARAIVAKINQLDTSIVQEQTIVSTNSFLKPESTDRPQKNLSRFYLGPPDERALNWELDAFGHEIAKQYGMKFHKVGSILESRFAYYGLIFQDFHHLITLDEARIMATTVIENFWKKLQNNPVVLKNIEARNEEVIRYNGKTILPNTAQFNDVALRIDFWDENVERPSSPYIAQIIFSEGLFYYYEADPKTQELKLVFKEPYEEALTFRNRV
jgi:hypothetical protein